VTFEPSATGWRPPAAGDVETIRAQLGRTPRGLLGVAARAADGTPMVIVTDPLLPGGSPFPTFYYLTLPALVSACSTLEAEGWMAGFTRRLAAEPELADAYAQAHERYLADRDAVRVVPELAGISAGGMPARVKCVHAVVGHALAAGPGVNPAGDQALRDLGWPGWAPLPDAPDAPAR
jgi:hypothetical protein